MSMKMSNPFDELMGMYKNRALRMGGRECLDRSTDKLVRPTARKIRSDKALGLSLEDTSAMNYCKEVRLALRNKR